MIIAIDYFTKWVEAASYIKITSTHVAKFLLNNIIYRYGVPHKLISDQGSHVKREVAILLKKYVIQHHKSLSYCLQANGAVKATIKNVCRIIEKMTENYKDWLDKLPFALWGFRMPIRTFIGITPYSLVYGMEAVLPIEIAMPSLRVIVESQILESESVKARYKELVMVGERRL